MTNLLDKLVLHPLNKQQLKQFLAAPAHALLLSGPDGSGKYHLAKSLATQLLGLDSLEALDSYAYFIYISKAADKQEVAIDDIRELIHKLRLKTTGRADVRRVVLIEDAHLMSLEAQTALLKILEEPPADTVFILTTIGPQALLPTVVSRSQRLEILAISLDQAKAYFASSKDSTIAKFWQLAKGRVGLLSALLADSPSHPLKTALEQVRPFLAGDFYQRLGYAQSLATDRQGLATFLEALGRVMQFLHHGALTKGNSRLAAKLQANRQLLKELSAQLAANGQNRLIGLSLALNLKS